MVDTTFAESTRAFEEMLGSQNLGVTTLREAGLPQDQIDTILGLNEHHPDFFKSLDLRPFLSAENAESRAQIMPFFEDDALMEKIAHAAERNPSISQRINYLIANDPATLTEITQNLQDDPDSDVNALLSQKVSDAALGDYMNLVAERAAEAEANAAETIFGQLGGGFLNDLLGFFTGDNGFSEIINKVAGFIGPLLQNVLGMLGGSVGELANSDAVVTDGNGDPANGPGAQAREVSDYEGEQFGPDGAQVAASSTPPVQPIAPQHEPDPMMPL